MPQRGNTTAGFTLIELLVVIAIVAILASILFPVFAKVREKARQTACISNLKQLGNAVLMYADDYDDYWPNCRAEWGTDDHWRVNYGTRYLPYFLQPYLRSSKVWMCPSDRGEPYNGCGCVAWKSLYEQCGSSYQWIPQKFDYPPDFSYYNEVWTGPVEGDGPDMNWPPWQGRLAAAAKRPADFPLVADTWKWHHEMTKWGGFDPQNLNARRSVWFADGHVRSLTESEFMYYRDKVVQYAG